jgi:hypothetical protein
LTYSVNGLVERIFRNLKSEWIPATGYNSEAEELAKKIIGLPHTKDVG